MLSSCINHLCQQNDSKRVMLMSDVIRTKINTLKVKPGPTLVH